ncbi:MAG: pyridoxamine 5'-phosphate oxidase family protein [Actinobacteria bacterium]|nr:pyridoxamine 5'-phosphate oxidase family protein [Actinomycetota bacterium]
MDELQRAIDVSLAGASPLTRRVYANDRWSAAAAQAFVNRVMAATIATVRSNGTPHAAVVLTACLRGTVIFTATTGSVLLRNLARQPAISMTVTDRDHDLTIHGEAERLGKAADLADLVMELGGLSRRGYFLPSTWDGYLYQVRIDRIFLSA